MNKYRYTRADAYNLLKKNSVVIKPGFFHANESGKSFKLRYGPKSHSKIHVFPDRDLDKLVGKRVVMICIITDK